MVEAVSVEEKAKLAVFSLCEPDHPDLLSVSRRVVSVLSVRSAGLASTLPAASLALTSKVCCPSVRALYSLGEEQALQPLPAVVWASVASRRHSKVALASCGEEKAKLAVRYLTRPEGPELMSVSGAAVSTVNVRAAGLASTLPAASLALT